ncbi:gamma-glutamyl-gamma-aminobutyrate hydrolase family protein [Miniimonas sp. S16]|uniref:glutamine amidotransferase-related protein n=1 Tax=Miniimonas sp. S16 TaxID=2171623 RepID=UPI00131F0EB3|nr:gamma-glutamyl-gamma-aminobutyrate hydrolase family protein [Miniimonas sp. S16]
MTDSSAAPLPTALVLRHAPDIGLGNVAGTLAAHGYAVTTLDAPTADLDGLDVLAPDVLVVLGGTEGAYQGEIYPYLTAETALLRRRADARRPILAICLGAQLLAQALGARAWRGEVHEVGFVPIDVTAAGVSSPVRHVAGVAMVEWHHDTFAVPDGAELLATTPAYPQAYRIGPWLLAVQFHPEVDEEIHRGWVRQWADEIEDGPTAEQLTADRARFLEGAQAASRAMVGEWLAQLG